MTGARPSSLLALHLAGVATIGASVLMVRANPYTTVLGTGAGWEWSALGASALWTAAVLSRTGRRRLALVIIAMLWFVPDWAGWVTGPAWIRVMAGAAGEMLVVVAVITAFELVGVAGRARKASLWMIVVPTSAISVATLWFVDPFEEPGCWRHCGHNPLLVSGVRAPAGALGLAGWFAALAAMAAAGLVLSRLVVGRTSPRGSPGDVTVVGAACLVLGIGVLEQFSDSAALGTATVGGVLVLAGLSSERWNEWRMRVALGRLIEDLRGAPAPGALAGALAERLGDPDLDVLFWSASRGEHVDAEGRPRSLPQSGERSVTAVVRTGEPVAALLHRRDLDPGSLDRTLRPAVRLWLSNDQIRASTLAELAELRASESRLADRTGEIRRRLERNLHDGAQQRVVGIALLLRMLRARHDNLVAPATPLVDRSAVLLDALLDDLRRVADRDPNEPELVRAENENS